MKRIIQLLIGIMTFVIIACSSTNVPHFTDGWTYEVGYWDEDQSVEFDTLRYYYHKNDSSMIVFLVNKQPVKIVKSKAKLIIK